MTGFKNLLIPFFIVFSGFVSLELTIPIAFGEFLAGIIGHSLFDLDNIPWLKSFSHLGLLGIMFLAGFEIEPKILKSNLKKSLLIGVSSFFIPYLLVIGVALFLNISFIKAMILGTALATTSLAMIFSILKGSGHSSTNEGQVILGSAMIVDILSMLSLTVIVIELSLYNLMFFIILLGGLLIIKKIVIYVFKRYKGNVIEFELQFLLLSLLGFGILAEEAGLHAALIAFLTGIIFSDLKLWHRVIIKKLNTVVFSLLAPIFFFHAGTLVSLENFTFSEIYYLGFFSVAAIGGKFLGTYISVYFLYNKNKVLAKYTGVIFNYRLSFGLVTAMYAFERGLIDLSILNIILLIVSISSVFAVLLSKMNIVKPL